jgi:hypothetical protein
MPLTSADTSSNSPTDCEPPTSERVDAALDAALANHCVVGAAVLIAGDGEI